MGVDLRKGKKEEGVTDGVCPQSSNGSITKIGVMDQSFVAISARAALKTGKLQLHGRKRRWLTKQFGRSKHFGGDRCMRFGGDGMGRGEIAITTTTTAKTAAAAGVII